MKFNQFTESFCKFELGGGFQIQDFSLKEFYNIVLMIRNLVFIIYCGIYFFMQPAQDPYVLCWEKYF